MTPTETAPTEKIDALIERQGWNHEQQAMLVRRFCWHHPFVAELLFRYLDDTAREEDRVARRELAAAGDPAPLADNQPAVPLDEVQAVAVFLGWDPEEQGPVDEAGSSKLVLHLDHHSGWSRRRFRVNHESGITHADFFIRAHADDPVLLAAVGRLEVGEVWDGGEVLHVCRLPDAFEEIKMAGPAGQHFAPDGWIEVQLQPYTDHYDSDLEAALTLDHRCAMLYRVATGEMAQLCDEEACDVLASRVNDREDIDPALICIVPRSTTARFFGHEE